MATKNTRSKRSQFNMRLSNADRQLIEKAIGLSPERSRPSLSDFIIGAAIERAEKLLEESAEAKWDDKMTGLSAGTEQKIDRLSDKIDKLVNVSASTNQKLDRLVEALLRREGQ